MTKEIKLKIKKLLKTIIQWATIIFGAIIAGKVIVNTLRPKSDKTVEDAKKVIEDTKLKVDYLETEKDEIEEEHEEILANKKARDEKAKDYFGDL